MNRIAISLALLLMGLPAVAAAEAKPEAGASVSVADQPMPGWKVDLIELAFDAATKIPLNPHMLDRAKTQHDVVEACFALNQPQRALGYTKQIPNWRRGVGYARYVAYAARHGQREGLEDYFNKAEELSKVTSQDWHKARILSALAEARLVMGQLDKARALADRAEVEDTEQGNLAAAQAKQGTLAYEEQVQVLQQLTQGKSMDANQHGVAGFVDVYKRHYKNAERREELEKRIATGASRLPGDMQVETQYAMIEAVLANGDHARAVEMINEIKNALADYRGFPETLIEKRTALAALLHKAGEKDQAKADLAEVLKLYDERRHKLLSIDYGKLLRGTAEVFLIQGDQPTAMKVYRRALEEGVVNPNSRPRAMDLAGLCLSLALNDVEPDGPMWERLRQINAGLSDPW